MPNAVTATGAVGSRITVATMPKTYASSSGTPRSSEIQRSGCRSSCTTPDSAYDVLALVNVRRDRVWIEAVVAGRAVEQSGAGQWSADASTIATDSRHMA